MIGRVAVVALLAFTISDAAHAGESAYTPTRGKTCRQMVTGSHASVWQCPGPAGYSAEFADEGNVVTVAVGPKGRTKRRDREGLTWRGAGRVFGDTLEWRLAGGKPTAAILRVWRIESDASGDERTVQELLVLKVTLEGACRAGSVDARRPDANAVARSLADAATSFRCGDQARYVGLSSLWSGSL
jgi:hypothetical protein